MKRYSKKVREEAALICAIAASSGVTTPYGDVQSEIGASYRAYVLAYHAYHATCDIATDDYEHRPCVRDAEAESLIRTGWSPP